MTTFEKHQVVMLPTNEKAVKGDIIGNNRGFTIADELYSLTELSFIQAKVYKLYFLSDEEIKKGDWMFHKLDEKPTQWNGEEINPSVYGYKKIIAATDRSLCYLLEPHKDQFGDMRYNKFHELPEPSQEFIEYFVKRYSKGNVITEVGVEYEKWIGKNYVGEFSTDQDLNYKLKINPDNTINIKPEKDSWNREEVMEIARRYAKRCQAPMTDTKWLEENL